MSFHRENIIWQSKDGSWNRGFYKAEATGDYSDPDFDPEWDVEYDSSKFEWVSTGHATQEAAYASWRGANPGGHWTLEYSRATAKECAALDEMVWRFRNPEAAIKKDQRALRAKIKKTMTEENLTAGSYVKITTSADANSTIESYATGMVFEGTLTQEGNWLVVYTTRGPQKVLNTVNGTIDRHVTSVRKAERVFRPTAYGRYW